MLVCMCLSVCVAVCLCSILFLDNASTIGVCVVLYVAYDDVNTM